ncbi:MAG: hypothetical protein ACPH5S_03980, partial [Candidatus Poseidoniaceae archaeon]
ALLLWSSPFLLVLLLLLPLLLLMLLLLVVWLLLLLLMVVLLRRQGLEVLDGMLDEDQTGLVDEDEQKSVIDLSDESASIEDAKMEEPILEPDVLSAMAQEATTSGVMQAIPGTEQGATGWYVDANATVQHWTVGEDGSWTKTQA